MPRPCELTFDPLTSKVVSESCVTWATSVPILVFLGLSALDLGPMYATDRQTSSDVRRASSLNASALWGRGHDKPMFEVNYTAVRSCVKSLGSVIVCSHADATAWNSLQGTSC